MHHHPIAYHPNIQKPKKKTFASIRASMCLCIHTSHHIIAVKRGIHVPNTLELLASMCSINIKQIIKRIHVRTNETPISKMCIHVHIYIYTSHTIHDQHCTCPEYPQYSAIPKNMDQNPSKLIQYTPSLQKPSRAPCSP